MWAWRCHDPRGIADLQWEEVDLPEPAAGQVRVKVRAASVNFPDLLVIEGKYQFKPTPPFVPGAELAGQVDAVGDGVTAFVPGQRVLSVGVTGAFATHACVAATKLVPAPPEMPFEEAAAFLMTYGTSHHALVDRAQLRRGETLVVLGAAGGVGSAAVQIGKAMGARVIAAVSSEEKASLCRRLGAEGIINYGTDDLREAIKALTDGRGPDVIYDPVGGTLAEPAFRSIAWRGRYLVVGFAQGGIPSLALNLPLLKGASIVGVFWGDYVRREPGAFELALAELARWYRAGVVRPAIDRVLPMTELKDALERVASRRALGKVVLVNPDGG
ncbi:MAG: NADPH:quinone oxidoreductase family protein [Proteobacteria bacterium]|nr:NADPH:quinone oxidoreductase family protein [Pseudomonadota bacterium]